MLAFGLVSRRFTTSTALTTALESSSRPSWPSASRWRSEKSGAARETRSVAWTRLTAQTPPSACSRPSKRSTRRPTVLTPCASCAPDDEPSGCRRPAARRGAVLVGARHWEGRSLRGACHRSGHWAVRWTTTVETRLAFGDRPARRWPPGPKPQADDTWGPAALPCRRCSGQGTGACAWPRLHLVPSHGVLAPKAKLQAMVVLDGTRGGHRPVGACGNRFRLRARQASAHQLGPLGRAGLRGRPRTLPHGGGHRRLSGAQTVGLGIGDVLAAPVRR